MSRKNGENGQKNLVTATMSATAQKKQSESSEHISTCEWCTCQGEAAVCINGVCTCLACQYVHSTPEVLV